MEALAVLVVAAVAGSIVLFAFVQQHFASVDPKAELQRLRRRAAWLQQRLDAARRENWDDDMISPIVADLTATSHQLLHLGGEPYLR